MIKNYYTKEEVVEIRNNLHQVLEFKKQFQKISLTEDDIMSNFLSGRFKPGSIEDPLLDCFGTAVFQYKFTNAVPKRINTMNNLPHIMDAEVVKTADAVDNNLVIKGEFSTFTYGAKPSSKKPGKAIVFGSWNRGEASYSFKYFTKIENAADNILKAKFSIIAKALDFISHYNISVEETEESKKGVYSITFSPAEVETYGQFFEIEAVEKEVNILSQESITEFINAVAENISEYQNMIEDIADAPIGTCREINIVKGGKNDKSYIATSSPEIIGNLIKLSGNITDEVTWISCDGVKKINEHVITEDDLEEMSSVIYDMEVTDAKEEAEEDKESESKETESAPVVTDEAPEAE